MRLRRDKELGADAGFSMQPTATAAASSSRRRGGDRVEDARIYRGADECFRRRARFIYPSRIVFPMGPPRFLGSVAVGCGGTLVL